MCFVNRINLIESVQSINDVRRESIRRMGTRSFLIGRRGDLSRDLMSSPSNDVQRESVRGIEVRGFIVERR